MVINAPKGNPPTIKVVTSQQKINMISAISNNGKVHFMIYEESMTLQRLIEFMKRMIQDLYRSH